MIIYKCKMCGGNLNVQKGDKVTVCEYCRTQQTIHSTDDEKRANLFNRANHFRQNGEFDKAMGIYEHILKEDSNDAEVYWLIVLCKYGIEYIEDSINKVQKPTINRTQPVSILKDADYLMALEHADYVQRKIYEKEAEEIERIRKEILLIAQDEKPYDIFISYKEKTRNGERTKASVLAQDIYTHLTQEGYRVFFSRISLEKMIGQKYEPYIYSALNTAKVMLVIATEKEEFMAPWVKNEWSRFLTMMRDDAGKVLIPCFRDLDIDSLPDEFQILQGQDMSKVGFEQDLLHGISKVIRGENESNGELSKKYIDTSQSNKRLIQNAETYMRIENFDSAYETYQNITKLYPEDYRGWWGLIQSSTKNLTMNDIEDTKIDVLNKWFEYIKKLASENIYKEKLSQYIDFQKNIFKVRALEEIEVITEHIKEYQSEIDSQSEAISNLSASEETQKQSFQKEIKEMKARIDDYHLSCNHLEKETGNTLFKLVITIIFIWGFAFYLLHRGTFLSSVVGFFLIFFAIAMSIAFWQEIKEINVNSNKKIKDIKREIYICEGIIEKNKNRSVHQGKAISDKKTLLYNSIEQYMQKISDCNRYLEYGLEEITDLLFALHCDRIGIEKELDVPLFELRNKVLNFSDGEGNTQEIETGYLEISCRTCKQVNKIYISDIRNNKNSFKCATCGRVIHVQMKKRG